MSADKTWSQRDCAIGIVNAESHALNKSTRIFHCANGIAIRVPELCSLLVQILFSHECLFYFSDVGQRRAPCNNLAISTAFSLIRYIATKGSRKSGNSRVPSTRP